MMSPSCSAKSGATASGCCKIPMDGLHPLRIEEPTQIERQRNHHTVDLAPLPRADGFWLTAASA